jgi:hypothetical protein
MSIQCNILQIIKHGFWLEVKGQSHRGQLVKITLLTSLKSMDFNEKWVWTSSATFYKL